MEGVSFRVAPGDKVGLVGRNGAGKTTLTKILAGEAQPAAGSVHAVGEVGYLPQDPRIGNPEVLARDRILSARGLDDVVRRMREAEHEMASADAAVSERAMRRYTRADTELHAGGGYAAESEAAQIAQSLGIEERVLAQPLKTLSGGQRRRVELARILFSGAETLLLDEPTNHLDADSIVWLREFLRAHRGGLIVISHDNDLLETTVNKVLHLDANRGVIDVYNMGWKAYLTQRETDERRRKRERANAESKAKTLTDQANRMRAKASKAVAAQSMLKRAEKMMAGLEGERAADKVARIKFPASGAVRQDPDHRRGALEVLRVARGLHRRRPRHRQGLARRHPRPQRRRQDHDAADPRRRRPARHRPGRGRPRPQARLLRPGARDPRHRAARCWRTCSRRRRSSPTARRAASSARSSSPATTPTSPRRVLSGGEKTRLALASLVVSSANVLLLDEPTNNLDPASREEVLAAIRTYEGAIILVTHDEGAVRALEPDRVLLLPDGDEDLWNDDYADLVSLA